MDYDQISSESRYRSDLATPLKSMKKVRFADIAREAHVGTATVERVLNVRGNVSPVTVGAAH